MSEPIKPAPGAPATPIQRGIPGRWVVVALFVFGGLSTAGIWTYWKLHLAPFLPLQRALADEFEKSSPRVDGGWTKENYRKEPPRLRIVLRVPYDPVAGDARVTRTISRVTELARKHVDLAPYESLTIYLVHYVPEKQPRQYEFEQKIRDLE